MKVEELIIDGFKSYATRTVISDWDPQFNAITGLNGSGKSNILDAICFVLGIASMTTVRASNLQDLIYKRGQAGVTKASVTIVFDNSDASKSPIGFESCSKISVTRQIILGGSSKYLVNGHKAQQQTVLNLFQSVQLNINNPNFLIMQGKITKVLNMKPSEILSLIEEAAGTRTFEERKDKAKKTMAKKDTKLAEIRSLLQEEIEPKLEKLRNDKRTFVEYQQVQTDLEKLTRIITAHDYTTYNEKYNDHKNGLSSQRERRDAYQREMSKRSDEITHLHNELDHLKSQHEEEMKKDNTIKSLEASENEVTEKITRLNTTKEITVDNLKEERKKKQKLQAQYTKVEQHVLNSDDIYKNAEAAFNSAKQKLNEIKQEHSKKEELLSTLSTGVSASGATDGGYVALLKERKKMLNDSSILIKQSQLKISHLREQISNDESKLRAARQETASLKESVKQYEKEVNLKEQELNNLGYDTRRIGELRKQENDLLNELHSLDSQLNAIRREVGNIDFAYSDPTPNFNRNLVRGVAAQLFTLKESETDKAMALQVCAGGRLFNVIVDTSDVASQILEKGQLRKRVTIIPLDKISSRPLGANTVNTAKSLCPGKVDLAINLIDFENELTQAMEYIFGSTFICDDPDTAKKVTFSNQIRARSITLEGDIYDPEGNLSGGSRKNTSSILLNMQKYNKALNRMNEVAQELALVQEELEKFSIIGKQTTSLQSVINLKKHELSLLQRKLDNNPSSNIIRNNESNQREIANLETLIGEEKQRSAQYESDILSIEQDMKEFNNDKGLKLKRIEKEVNELRELLVTKEDEIEEKSQRFQSIELETEQYQAELSTLKEDLETCVAAIKENENELALIDKKIADLSTELASIRVQLDEERANLLGLKEELNAVTKAIQEKKDEINELQLNIQKLDNELEKSTSISNSLQSHIDKLIELHSWVTDSNVLRSIIDLYPNIDLNECRLQVAVLEERFQGMRRKVNPNIMSMIDNVEKKEVSLRQMIRTIEKDKAKIVNTIEKLNGYKRDTLNATYQKVSVDFGQIFGDLLTGSFAKLVPVDNDDVTKGLEVKVKLGPVWKESLVELSGGQRSLIALSLIMALLQFKPAPMYILDEVDAALDLSHTQNIGHLIKTRFKGSQFIIVSLKEGMFTNANRVFRTRFQDGTSVVSVM